MISILYVFFTREEAIPVYVCLCVCIVSRGQAVLYKQHRDSQCVIRLELAATLNDNPTFNMTLIPIVVFGIMSIIAIYIVRNGMFVDKHRIDT